MVLLMYSVLRMCYRSVVCPYFLPGRNECFGQSCLSHLVWLVVCPQSVVCPQFIVCVPSFYLKEIKVFDRAALPIWCGSLCLHFLPGRNEYFGQSCLSRVVLVVVCPQSVVCPQFIAL